MSPPHFVPRIQLTVSWRTVTTEVTNEALQDPTTSVILCYHPPIFSGLKSIKVANPLQHSILKCIASGVSIFCIQ